ncbi:midasin [Panus rudis PR-1116 ss-1]|nr:midasin [Panus rudis PR-1116 ss-1]
MVSSTVHDPLTINLKLQTQNVLGQIPTDSPYATRLKTVTSRSELLQVLSELLAVPALTWTIATAFRPILLDLCARWLQDGGDEVDRLEALCLLLEVHPEIYSIFSAFTRRYQNGPLDFIESVESPSSIDCLLLHRLLLAYYRILQASRTFPQSRFWSLEPLAKLIRSSHPDYGVRFLAIRCYALQSGMMEGDRVKLEQEIIGEVEKVDCPILYGSLIDGSPNYLDGWIMPLVEAQRVVDARNSHLEPQSYYSVEGADSIEPIHPAELSPNIVNIHGILMYCPSGHSSPNTKLIPTPTVAEALRTLTSYVSMGLPILLTSSPSAGKSLLLSYLASVLYPNVRNQIVTIHLADTSLDPRSLLGSYVSSTTRPGTFEWRAGVLVRAMREGKWVVFEDIDRGSNEVLGLIKPLVESLGVDKWIGGRARMEVPNIGLVEAEESFAVFATRSCNPLRDGKFPQAAFFGVQKFQEMTVASPTHQELRTIIDAQFPRLAGVASEGIIRMWEAIRNIGTAASTREIGLRELEKLCQRIDNLLPSNYEAMDLDEHPEQTLLLTTAFPNPNLREDILFEARDVLFGAGATTSTARAHLDAIASLVAEHLALTPERRDWVLGGKIPEYHLEKDINGAVNAVSLGRTRLVANPEQKDVMQANSRPFALHKPAVLLMSRIATAVSLNEPVLLTGETGTGKTSVVTHLAALLRKPLIALNMSNQTESSDIVGGFKPVDARVPASDLQVRFLDLFGGTFSRKRNAKFEESVRKAVQEGKWKRAVALWLESAKMAKERIQARAVDDSQPQQSREGEGPRKRRKTDHQELNVSEMEWSNFERDVRTFELQHVQGNGKFAFGFVEGPLVKALRAGHWILLDEINLASSETLECISSLLHGPTASITLTEQGSLEPVPRHPEFRLFACMNPATDVGKKDLPPNIRSRFLEIDVPPPDADKETLLSIVNQYIGPYAVGDKAAVMDVAEFYTSVRQLAERREIADGSNHRPHFSMRTLARALTFAADLASAYSLRRALWEGCLMAFTMVLDEPSAKTVTTLAQKYILSNVRNPRSLLAKEPSPPTPADQYVKFGPFYLERGPLPEDPVEDYIMTPSVEQKLIDLARIIVTRRFPVLIEGPTSSGKTSSIEYLAKRTGHRFVRINNHEHTDIQEYTGTYVSDPATGKLIFRDGLLVRALREGHWIVLDELNLAPTDVLEALNRLLDDNRELVIPETQEVVKPHPHFLLFATQNPPGLYAGRKVLSRAFRNRFLEVHFEDVPQGELETILCQRCRIAPSHGQRIVAVFQELQKRRQSSRIFESKHGFATLRDLFRWAGRDAISYQELADNGYMLLAERARRPEDKLVVKEVIESIMKVKISESELYNFRDTGRDLQSYLGCPLPPESRIVWTSAMQRLFVLVARALRFNEPVLLVGETGCGKTTVCQLYAEVVSKHLYAVNCHQNTETADLIGGLRPMRNRNVIEGEIIREVHDLLVQLGESIPVTDAASAGSTVDRLLKSGELDETRRQQVHKLRTKCRQLQTMFQWYDGPLIEAMRKGDVFLLDEISLADDSVLERLNSVLEPSRTVVLAERGDDDADAAAVKAHVDFKLIATMNPGGDYGKKELSPALRNRFTEIWVPAVSARQDFEQIVASLWQHEELCKYTAPVLDFAEWLGGKLSDPSAITLRDILAWVNFSNAVFSSHNNLSADEIFHHAARLTFLDGLGSLPQLASYSKRAIDSLRQDAIARLQEILPVKRTAASDTKYDSGGAGLVQLGAFAIPRGPEPTTLQMFSLEAPTTRDNVARVVRACQLPKPILLEGSPGVGKTSLVTALANMCGYKLCRINLSDQTDIIDLFGSDLPVEGQGPGQFAWRDAEFLKAMQEGQWVLLDEMNLAPQAILEGLNAVLDHRGSVFIPELGRTFTRHPSFRIFAAQNPLHQGGGRKGLPKSFLNRFTKVYVEELTNEDVLLVARGLFPEIPSATLQRMTEYTSTLNEEIMIKRRFARDGAPWEFNLRDVIRWGSLVRNSGAFTDPGEFLSVVFLQRFRTVTDRQCADQLWNKICDKDTSRSIVRASITPWLLQVGHSDLQRVGYSSSSLRPGRLLPTFLPAIEGVSTCLKNNWLAILTGPHDCGKSSLVRALAHMTGHPLREIAVSSGTDTSDILGSFEEVDQRSRVLQILESCFAISQRLSGSYDGFKRDFTKCHHQLLKCIADVRYGGSLEHVRSAVLDIFQQLQQISTPSSALLTRLRDDMSTLLHVRSTASFEWVDGPLVKAVKDGSWLLLDGANLCNPSVLDRLNALCESGGYLALNERGPVDGQIQILTPHPDFKLFMTVDPRHGELSRAMRNRGIEITILPSSNADTDKAILDHSRLPSGYQDLHDEMYLQYELMRRGISLETSHPVSEYPLARLLGEDSASAYAIELCPSLCVENVSLLPRINFATHSAAPLWLPVLIRFLSYASANKPALRVEYDSVSTLPLSDTYALCVSIRNEVAHECNLSQEILLAQPLDLFLFRVPLHQVESTYDSRRISNALLLRLHASIQLLKEQLSACSVTPQSDPSWQDDSQATIHSRVKSESVAVLHCVIRASQSTHTSVRIHEKKLSLLLRLLGYSRYLAEVISQDAIDYSAMQAILPMYTESLHESIDAFADVAAHIQSLSQCLSLSSGAGMTALWAGLNYSISNRVEWLDLSSMDVAASTASPELRRNILELIALSTVPQAFGIEEQREIMALRDRLHQHHHDRTSQHEIQEDLLLLLSELGILAALSPNDNVALPEILIDTRLRIACSKSRVPLLRLAPYIHLQWATRSNHSILPAVALLHKGWHEAIWSTVSVGEVDGPAVICIPIELHDVLSLCDRKGRSLRSLDMYKATLQDSLSALPLRMRRTSRVEEVACLLVQSFLMIVSTFHLGVTGDDAHDTTIANGNWRASLSGILTLLADSRPGPLPDAHQLHTRRPLETLLQLPADATSTGLLSQLGRCWLSLAQLLAHLFVPTTPIDPARIEECLWNYWNEEREYLLDEIRRHVRLEQRISGQDENGTITFLSNLLQKLPTEGRQEARHHTRRDLSRLQTYWSELNQFFEHVVSPGRIVTLVSSFESSDDAGKSREHVVQESILAFCQRLSTLYADFSDINLPIQLALYYLKFGVRIMRHASTPEGEPALVGYGFATAAYPSVLSADQLSAQGSSDATSPTFSGIHTKLCAIWYKVSAGFAMETLLPMLDTLYQQAYGLWAIDRVRDEEREKQAQSLYRQRTTDHVNRSDAELEEEEFLEMFPEFEDILEEGRNQDTSSKPSRLISPEHISLLVEVHYRLFSHPRATVMELNCAEGFANTRELALREAIIPDIARYPETLDSVSIPYQLALVRRRLDSLATRTDARNVSGHPYNFYHDENIPEARKALAVIQKVARRLQDLIQEWPDQMVLQHLLTRAEAILNLDLRSSLASLLSALEQFLLKTEDWEMYANRENSLKSYQQELAALIVEWRRLELSTWKDLLDSQAMSFARETSEWFFRLYELLVHGAVNAVHDLSSDEDTTAAYLDNVVDLLSDFLKAGPVGQYSARLTLLASMEAYLLLLSGYQEQRIASILHRVHRIVCSTRQYFLQYEPKVLAGLKEQRSGLEKNIREFIKLASWRDINVQALKQSAQKTHRMLFRNIRKYREILRQPVIDLLAPTSAFEHDTRLTAIPAIPSPSTIELEPVTEFPQPVQSSGKPSYLLQLTRTYANYKGHLEQELLPYARSQVVEHLDSLAEEIIGTAKALSSTTLPAGLDAARRSKVMKNLLTRKRKAWSDLLKELKRAGLAPNVKPEILAQNQSMRWLREQPLISGSDMPASACKVEEYFQRLLGAMPVLRSSLSTHHSDLSTRELQRGVMFLESSISLAVRARACFAEACSKLNRLRNMRARLKQLLECSTIDAIGHSALECIESTCNTAAGLSDALREITADVQYMQSQEIAKIPDGFFTDLRSALDAVCSKQTALRQAKQQIQLTQTPILLRNEAEIISSANEVFDSVSAKLTTWLRELPDLRHFIHPVTAWLSNRIRISTSKNISNTVDCDEDCIIEPLLLSVQSLLSASKSMPSPSGNDITAEAPDGYIRDGIRQVSAITTKLDLDRLSNEIDLAVQKLATLKETDVQTCVRRFLPFLTGFVAFADVQVQAQGEWTRALFKLNHVLCNIMSTLAREGFCQPQETEEGDGNGDEEGGKQAEGLGLGEGTGKENVSKEIQDESQVEGLQGEDGQDEDQDVERADEGNAIEMSEDVGGKMQDVEDTAGEEGDEEEEEEDEMDPDDAMGNLDANDETAIDEKLWGDESGPQDQTEQSKQGGQDDSKQQSSKSEMAAKDDKPEKNSQGKEEKQPEGDPNQTSEDADVEEAVPEEPEDAGAEGAPMDDHVPNTDILDLPDNMDMDADLGKDSQEPDMDIDDTDMGDMEDVEDAPEADREDREDNQDIEMGDQGGEDEELNAGEDNPMAQDGEPEPSEENADTAVAEADVHGGEGSGDSRAAASNETTAQPEAGESADKADGQGAGAAGDSQKNEDVREQEDGQSKPSEREVAAENSPVENAGDSGSSGTKDSVAGPSSQSAIQQLSSNPMRSLGDALREIAQRFDEILEGDSSDKPPQAQDPTAGQLEYVQEHDDAADMQALGPAGHDEVAKLNELKMANQEAVDDQKTAGVDDQLPSDPSDTQMHPDRQPFKAEEAGHAPQEDVSGALLPSDVRKDGASHTPNDVDQPMSVDNSHSAADDDESKDPVERQLRLWQAQGQPSGEAERIWRLYESLTHDLSYALCEQLRLILEPTQATRLKGDYRTGKRLNMKKIISYIASEYTKDKIWLRRTRPSQREYQVLVALDDSRSMAESHSVHLAFQTLALVSKALSRLEVGDVGIARFGESVDILHGFDQGPFSDQAGTKIMDAFKFNQKATQVLSLVERSLSWLEEARERRAASSSTAGDLWQMEIIISDGICQDHDKLRTILRKAEEQRVMVVFIILDSLHTGSPTPATSVTAAESQKSILSMKQVAYKEVDGRLDLTVSRYLDTFPFEYYVVVRDVEALPDVLASTLKQFFERISEE